MDKITDLQEWIMLRIKELEEGMQELPEDRFIYMLETFKEVLTKIDNL